MMSDHLPENLFSSGPSGRKLDFSLLGLSRYVALGALCVLPWAQSAGASGLCDPCVVHIPPGSIASPIPLAGWLAPADTAGITVATQPAHGQWNGSYTIGSQTFNGAYLPDESTFWQVGIDQVEFDVLDGSGQPLGPKTLILVADNPQVIYERQQDFTTLGTLGDLIGWTVVGNDGGAAGTPSRPGGRPLVDTGTTGLSILATANSQRYVESPIVTTPLVDPEGNGQHIPTIGATGGRMVATANTEPDFAPPVGWFEMTILNLDDLVYLEMRVREDADGLLEAEARATVNPAAFCADVNNCTAELETSWVTVDANGGHLLQVQLSERATATGLAPQWSLVFRVTDQATSQLVAVEQIWPGIPVIPPTLSSQTGVVTTDLCDDGDPNTDCGIALEIQSLDTYAHLFEQQHTVFHTDFEDPTGITTGAPLNQDDLYFEGQEAYSIFGPSIRPGGPDLVFKANLMSLQPSFAAAGYGFPVNAPERAGFTLYSLNGEEDVMVMASVATSGGTGQFPPWASVELLEFGRAESLAGYGPLEVRLRTNGQLQREIRMRVFANGQVLGTSWIPTGPSFDMAVRWRRDTSGGLNPNGYAAITVNGHTEEFKDLDNWQTAEYVALGAWELSLPYLPTGSFMTMTFDNVAMAYEDLLP